jgi:hypothetical protein
MNNVDFVEKIGHLISTICKPWLDEGSNVIGCIQIHRNLLYRLVIEHGSPNAERGSRGAHLLRSVHFLVAVRSPF